MEYLPCWLMCCVTSCLVRSRSSGGEVTSPGMSMRSIDGTKGLVILMMMTRSILNRWFPSFCSTASILALTSTAPVSVGMTCGPSSVSLDLVLKTSSVAAWQVLELRSRTWMGVLVHTLSARGKMGIMHSRSSTLLLPLLSFPTITSCGGCHPSRKLDNTSRTESRVEKTSPRSWMLRAPGISALKSKGVLWLRFATASAALVSGLSFFPISARVRGETMGKLCASRDSKYFSMFARE
mmetsp:Transcript_16323/g.39817  ORF Transcript_16323/g.39817 Transcript_16323/m.39817 type:complete len:238 (+) Transcript_16323:1224-1937(+)